MSWQDAKTAAEAIAANLPADMKGKSLQVADFATDYDCHAFYSWGLGFHRMILSALRKIAWKRGSHFIHPVYLTATPRALRLTADERTELANRLFNVVDVPTNVPHAKAP
jgi:hypothetical protein